MAHPGKQRPPAASLLIAVALYSSGLTNACSAQHSSDTVTYSHIVVEKLVHDVDASDGTASSRTEIAYLSLPGRGPVVAKRDLPLPSDGRGHVLAVGKEAIFFSARGRFIERVELANSKERTLIVGSPELIMDSPRSDYFFTAPEGENVVYRYDVAAGRRDVLVDRSEVRPNLLGGLRKPKVAISPDSRHVATATYHDGNARPRFAVEVFEIDSALKAQPKLSHLVRGELLMTGAGSPVAGPAMVWTDASTLLLLVPKSPPEIDGVEIDVVLELASGENSHSLMKLDIETEALESLFDLRVRETRTPFKGPHLWKSVDEQGQPCIMVGEHEIDLQNGLARSTNRLAGHYRLQGDGRLPSLWYKDIELAAKVTGEFVSVSPDGQQVVWFVPVNPNNVLGYASLQSPQVLNHHSPSTGVTPLATGEFSSSRFVGGYRSPVSNGCVHWIP